MRRLGLCLLAVSLLYAIYFFWPKPSINSNSKVTEIKKAIADTQLSTPDEKPRSKVYLNVTPAITPPSETTAEKTSLTAFQNAMKAFGNSSEDYKRHLEEALRLNPNNSKALGHYSELLLKEGLIEDSRRQVTHCLGVNPSESVCHRSLISSFTLEGDFEGAYEYLLDCVDLDPKNIHCLSALSTALLKQDDLEAAAALIDSMDDKNNENQIWIHLSKAQYYQRTGEQLLAKEHFHSACELGQAYACKMTAEYSKAEIPTH